MNRCLCISVTLLDPLFHGKADPDPGHPDGRPEWPPSPMRLFQALVAAARGGCRAPYWSGAHAEAFRWLERLDPPHILGPDARPAASYTLFVPNNDGDKKFNRQDRLTSKVVRPVRLTWSAEGSEGSTLHYLWPISEADWPTARGHAQLLCEMSRHLVALGWGIDQAVAEGRILTGAEAIALTGKKWRAWRSHRGGSPTWRVPAEGSLKDLEETYESWTQRIDAGEYHPPRKPTRFDTVHYLSSAVFPPRAHAVFELPEGRAFRAQDVAKVAAMLRSLACRCAKDDTHAFPGGSATYVAGHVGEREESPPRFSYLPLPTIGHEHADGMIRRLLVAEPLGGDGTNARWAEQRLRDAVLHDEDGRECGVLLDLWRPSSPRIVERYIGEARAWCTVTPVVLPGFDDGKHAKAEQVFLKAVVQAEIPVEAIEEFTLRRAPFWPGAHHPSQYFVPAYIRRFPRWHLTVRFRERIQGPLTIGAGRHVGLGMFATWR